MVDRISNTQRERTFRWTKIATIILVGVSAGLISVQGGASLQIIAAATCGGFVVGAALVWYLFPDLHDLAPASSQRFRE